MHSIEQIGSRFWYISPISETDRPILGMVVGQNKTLMIDAGNSEDHAQYFLAELQKRNVDYPDIVVLTHSHWDHIFGLPALTKAVSISTAKTKDEMIKLQPLSWSDQAIDARVQEGTEIEFCATAIKKEFTDHRDMKVLLPDITFENRLEIDLGGVTCVIQHVGGSHAADSAIVYVKEEKILFLGDVMYCKMYAEKWHYKIDETMQLLDIIESFDVETYILSHSKAFTKEEFKQDIAMFRAIAACTESCKGDEQKVKKTYQLHTGKELDEYELEVIEQFVNGYER